MKRLIGLLAIFINGRVIAISAGSVGKPCAGFSFVGKKMLETYTVFPAST